MAAAKIRAPDMCKGFFSGRYWLCEAWQRENMKMVPASLQPGRVFQQAHRSVC